MTTSPRKMHSARLSLIRELTGIYSRRFTFLESQSFLNAYTHESTIGYPKTEAVQRSWDYYFAGRNVFGGER